MIIRCSAANKIAKKLGNDDLQEQVLKAILERPGTSKKRIARLFDLSSYRSPPRF